MSTGMTAEDAKDAEEKTVLSSVSSASSAVIILWFAIVAAAAGAAGHAQPAGTNASRTVWDGVYTEAQGLRGEAQYKQSCASCHGQDLRGDGTAPSLLEESFAFLFDDLTLRELMDRVQRMPPDRPNSLPAQAYSDVLAFVLQSNKFPAGTQELAVEPDALDGIRITKKP
jgi:mono/diheme cytochrome c family protein